MSRSVRRFALLSLQACLLTAAGSPAAVQAAALPQIVHVPESERPLDKVILGIDDDDGRYFLLPSVSPPAAVQDEAEWTDIQARLFEADFEISHGKLIQTLPSYSVLYVGIPEPGKGHALPDHAEQFVRRYLRERCRWSEGDLAGRVRFFSVPSPLVWTQDCILPLGRDQDGKLVLADSPADSALYRGFVGALVAAYPDEFTLLTLPSPIRVEGGDLAVTRGPFGRTSLIVGRHRVLDFLAAKGMGDYRGKPMPRRFIHYVETCYGLAFGLPAQVLPERPLREGWGDEELFHLDMVAAFFQGGAGAAAAVPRMSARAVDQLQREPLAARKIEAWNREFDATAAEIREAGYEVVRPELADNPVRNPVNVLKEPGPGASVLYLARYPESAKDYLAALDRLSAAGAGYGEGRRGAGSLPDAFGEFWDALDRVDAEPAPTFDKQAAVLRTLGCRVVPIPSYPWGAGGPHCQVQH